MTDLDTLAGRIAEGLLGTDEAEQRLALGLYRLLAEGAPVPLHTLARRVGLPVADVERILDGWTGVILDEHGDVVGFWGLTLLETPHRFETAGRVLFTWCAWDTLFLPALLGVPARVTSACAITGRPVRLTITADAVSQVDPPGAVLSFLDPSCCSGDDVQERFCQFVHFLSSAEAGDRWLVGHPSGFVLSIGEGFHLGRLTNDAAFGVALGREGA